ncbi:MAG: type II toxin-antitoxin system VapC family toxin [Thermodesulfobacteriota bacterium]
MENYFLNLDEDEIKTLERRYIILLDTSFWIHLLDGKNQKNLKLRDRLLNLAKKEKIICPLSAPTIWELRKQSSLTTNKSLEMIDNLSLNISFRSSKDIFNFEIAHFLEYIITGIYEPLTVSEKFGPLISYLASSFTLKGGCQDKLLSEQVYSFNKNLNLSEYLKIFKQRTTQKINYKLNYQTVNNRRREFVGKSTEKARRIEIEYIANNIIVPKLNDLRRKFSIDKQLKITQKIKELPKSKKYNSAVEHILKFMPFLSAFVEMNTISGLDNNRKDNPNDFFDRELLVYGLSYSSIFAADDKWVNSIIKHPEISKMFKFTKFAYKPKELDKHLDSIFTKN